MNLNLVGMALQNNALNDNDTETKLSLIETAGLLEGGVKRTFLQRINVVNDQLKSIVSRG